MTEPVASAAPPYGDLNPDSILTAVESTGLRCDGRMLALNSYENRVYQIGIEDDLPVVVKFYRPQRWSDAAILEEHAFSQELADREIPVVPPLRLGSSTLHHAEGFRLAVFPRRGGRMPDLDQGDNRLWMGRYLGRLHAVGAVRPFRERGALTIGERGHGALATILDCGYLPAELSATFESVARDVLQRIEQAWQRGGDYVPIRLHGDCHLGNILWTEQGPHIVDLDDAVSGPAIQDLWMLLSGDRNAMQAQILDILEGYEEFFAFDPVQLHLLEALRSLRMLHHAAWLARRWHDPAFPLAFPWFAESRYWEEQILALREQMALLDEPPLQI